MEFDYRGSNGSAAGSVISVPPAFPLIRSRNGSKYFVARIERLGSPGYRTDRRFGGSTSLVTDQGAFDFFLERLQLDALRVPSQPGLVD
ncbi:hypothetical protein DY000_02031777 [Brassica cretica]|uniref:Uncharacterized protein n=1 Tax=Brassica cretica TaxID=69181 RepID=A0ABQ7DR59_BRACR|nr:hypothetical protein DY000_02031777 [Brassica cretica]